jgi:hypothetical protein
MAATWSTVAIRISGAPSLAARRMPQGLIAHFVLAGDKHVLIYEGQPSTSP